MGTAGYEIYINKGVYDMYLNFYLCVLTCVIIDGILNLYFKNVLCAILWWVATW